MLPSNRALLVGQAEDHPACDSLGKGGVRKETGPHAAQHRQGRSTSGHAKKQNVMIPKNASLGDTGIFKMKLLRQFWGKGKLQKQFIYCL